MNRIKSLLVTVGGLSRPVGANALAAHKRFVVISFLLSTLLSLAMLVPRVAFVQSAPTDNARVNRSSGEDDDHEVAKSQPGDLLWEDQFDRAGSDDAPPFESGIAVEGAGAFVAGHSVNANGDADFMVRAYDIQTGTLRWADYFDNASGDDGAMVVKAHGGRVFAAGFVSNAAGTLVLAIRAYDSKTGAFLWQDQIDPGAGFFNFFEDLAVQENMLFAVGVKRRGPGNRDWIVRAYDATTGALLWQDQFDRAGRLFDWARRVVADNGRVFVTGTAQSAAPDNFGDFYVRAYDARTGRLLWEDHANGTGFGDGVGIALADGRVFVSGTVENAQFGQDWMVRAYNPRTGTMLWADQFNKGRDGANIAFDLAADQGRVFAAGNGGPDCLSLSTSSNCDFMVRGYDGRTGAVLWEDQLDRNGADDRAFRIAAQENRVFAVGWGNNDCTFFGSDLPTTNCNLLVRAYGARSGRLLWEDEVDKTGGNDDGTGVGVAGRRVVVAGSTALPGTPARDVLVRAYDFRDGDGEEEREGGAAFTLERIAELPQIGEVVQAGDTERGRLLARRLRVVAAATASRR